MWEVVALVAVSATRLFMAAHVTSRNLALRFPNSKTKPHHTLLHMGTCGGYVVNDFGLPGGKKGRLRFLRLASQKIELFVHHSMGNDVLRENDLEACHRKYVNIFVQTKSKK